MNDFSVGTLPYLMPYLKMSAQYALFDFKTTLWYYNTRNTPAPDCRRSRARRPVWCEGDFATFLCPAAPDNKKGPAFIAFYVGYPNVDIQLHQSASTEYTGGPSVLRWRRRFATGLWPHEFLANGGDWRTDTATNIKYRFRGRFIGSRKSRSARSAMARATRCFSVRRRAPAMSPIS